MKLYLKLENIVENQGMERFSISYNIIIIYRTHLQKLKKKDEHYLRNKLRDKFLVINSYLLY